MMPVSDAFLLNIAEVSATLMGLFVVGVFFYVDKGLRRLDDTHDVVAPYVRAGTRIVLVLYAIPLGLSLTLVVLEPIWTRVLFAVLSLVLVAANLDTAARIRAFVKVAGSSSFPVNEVGGTVGVAALVVTPWVLGGRHPGREDFTWTILLSLVVGFLSTSTVVLSVFDIIRLEPAHGVGSSDDRV
jgi:hypothetical protein